MWSNLLVKRAYNCFNQAVQQTWRIIRLLKRTGRPEARPPDVSVKEQVSIGKRLSSPDINWLAPRQAIRSFRFSTEG